MSKLPPETNYLETMEEFPLALIGYENAWDGVLWALCEGFPFLTYPQIANPPSGWFEASLVRQIGVWIMIEKLGVPKKATIQIVGVTKEMTWRCFPKIKKRLQHPKFKDHVEHILADAIERIELEHEVQKYIFNGDLNEKLNFHHVPCEVDRRWQLLLPQTS